MNYKSLTYYYQVIRKRKEVYKPSENKDQQDTGISMYTLKALVYTPDIRESPKSGKPHFQGRVSEKTIKEIWIDQYSRAGKWHVFLLGKYRLWGNHFFSYFILGFSKRLQRLGLPRTSDVDHIYYTAIPCNR